MAYRVVNEVDAAGLDDRIAGHAESVKSSQGVKSSGGNVGVGGGGSAGGSAGAGGRKMDEEEERDAVFFRLEMLGYRVGQGLVERYVFAGFFVCSYSFPKRACREDIAFQGRVARERDSCASRGRWSRKSYRPFADTAPITGSPATDHASQTPST